MNQADPELGSAHGPVPWRDVRDPSLQKREGQALRIREARLGPPGREDREVLLASS